MSNIIRLHVEYNLVKTIPDLKDMMDLVAFVNQSDSDQWTGSYIENNERWLWADVNTRSPEINKDLIFAFIFNFKGKVFNYPFFVEMDYNKLFLSVPSYLPNSIKTYSNLIDWDGSMGEMSEDKGEPIYKTWIEYFEGYNQDILQNLTKTKGYVNSNLWSTLDVAPIISALANDGYVILDTTEYATLLHNCKLFDYRLSLEELIVAEQNCLDRLNLVN